MSQPYNVNNASADVADDGVVVAAAAAVLLFCSCVCYRTSICCRNCGHLKAEAATTATAGKFARKFTVIVSVNNRGIGKWLEMELENRNRLSFASTNHLVQRTSFVFRRVRSSSSWLLCQGWCPKLKVARIKMRWRWKKNTRENSIKCQRCEIDWSIYEHRTTTFAVVVNVF